MNMSVNSTELNKLKNSGNIVLVFYSCLIYQNDAYEVMKKKGDSKPHILFLPLENVSFTIASTLFRI